MRVLLITNDYPPKPGGIQQYLGNIVAHSHLEFRVLAPKHRGAPEEAGVARGHRSYMGPNGRARRWVERHVREFDPDVIVFGAPHPLAQLGPGLRARFGIPYVVIAHGAEVTLPAAVPIARQILGRTFSRAALVFTVSEFTARRVSAMSDASVAVLGAGVDLDSFTQVARQTSDPLTLLCVSRFIPRKGHVRVIAAAEKLAATGTPTEVVIVGKGRLESRIRRRAAGAAVPVRMEVDVEWSRLPQLYAGADIFAMPARSRWFGLEVEGLGIVYLEAAAVGLPVIAGRSGGAPETVVPGVTGYVAESVDELVEAVRLIVDHQQELGEAGRSRAVEQYSWDAVVERFERGLAEVIA